MSLTLFRRTLGNRGGTALLACLAMVAALLAWTAGSARAADGCTGPFTIAVSGPSGSGVAQPAGQPVRLTVLAADGSPASTSCPVDGKPFAPAVSFIWQVPYYVVVVTDGSSATLTPTYSGGFAATVSLQQDFVKDPVGNASVRLDIRPQPSVIVTQPPLTAGVPTALTAVPAVVGPPDPGSPSRTLYAVTWDFGDGTSGSEASSSTQHVYPAAGDYVVKSALYDQIGRPMGNARQTVHVYEPLAAAFTAPATIVSGVAAAFDGTPGTSDDGAPVSGYVWDFGDGGRATGPTPTHVYWTTGTFTVTESVTDSLGRTATATHDITVSPAPEGGPAPSGTPPVPSFTTTTPSAVAQAPVVFDGTASADGDGSIVSYAWTFGDGGTDSRMTPQHTYGRPGDYPVTLTVTDDDGLSRSVTHTVSVADAPPAAAFTTPDVLVAGSAVAFDATGSSDPDGTVKDYAWDFGDGSTGTGAALPHPYAKAGTYDVVLTVTDDAGLTDSVTRTVAVGKAAPVASFPAPAGAVATRPVPFDGTPSSDVDGSIAGYAWNFGDGFTSADATPSHAFATSGSYTVTLTVTDDDGLTGTTSRTVDLAGAPPVATFTAPTGAVGVSTAFDGTGSSDPDGSIRSYSWDFGDGHTVLGATPGHTFETPNTYPVTLTVTDDSGMTSSVTHLVSVGASLPSAVFVPGASAPTVGSPVTFDASGSTAPGGIASYAWAFGDGGTGTTARPSHTYKTAGSYPVALTVTDTAGHSASVTHLVNAHWPATDLAVSVGGSIPRAGQYTYRVTVKNLGHTGAHGIVLANTLDPTQVLAGKVSAPFGVSCGGVALGATGTVTCKAPSAVLAAGKSWVITFTVEQPLTSTVRQVTETSTVRAANPDAVTRNNTARRTTAV